jgi:hypothetical protein
MEKWRRPQSVFYVFERGHKYQAEAGAFLTAMSQDQELAKRNRYYNHVFEDKRKAYGLQAADIFAWTITKATISGPGKVSRSLRPFVPVLTQFFLERSDKYQIHTFTGDVLVRLFEEQLRNPVYLRMDLGPRERAFR